MKSKTGNKSKSSRPASLDALPALKRAAKNARKLAIETGTPFYVWRNGKVVNLNPNGRLKAPRRRPL